MSREVARRVGLNSTWLLLTRASGQALMFWLAVVVARQLGEAGLGQFAFISAVLFVGNVLTTFGLDTLLIREIAGRQGANMPLIPAALVLQLAISTLIILLIVAFAGRLPNQTAETWLALRLASLSLIPLALATVYSAALRAYERMDLYLLFSLLGAATQVAISLFLLNHGQGVVGLAWAILVGQLLAAGAAAGLCWGLLPGFSHDWRTSRSAIWRATKLGWRLALLMVLAVLYQRLGIFSLSLLSDHAATGWFSAAARIVEAAKAVPYAFFGALFPLMTRQARRTSRVREQLGSTPRTWPIGQRLLLLYGIICGIGLTLLSGWLIPWLYGPAYRPAVTPLRILAWSLVPFGISLHLSFELIAQGRDSVALKLMGLTAGFTALLCALAIPTWGLNGACWAILVGETIQAAMLLAGVRVRKQVSGVQGQEVPG
jgi:O-antigen/teichoic acid export membrane protein